MFQAKSAHRPRLRFGCFDDPITGRQTFIFRLIADFVLDPMHLIDGGVIKDFFKRILERIRDWNYQKAELKLYVVELLQKWIDHFNKTKILELCKFR
jgi:hypothetical protein